MRHFRDFLPPLQELCLPLGGIIDPTEFNQETTKTTHVSFVSLPVFLAQLQHVLKRNRRQIQRHRLQIQFDHAFA